MPDVMILGQYYPGNSVVHRMDPRMKVVLSLALIIFVFLCQTFSSLLVAALFVAAFVAAARIPPGQAARSVAPLMFIVVITMLINLFFTHSGNVLVHAGIITITEGSVRAALFFGIRLTILLFAVSLLTLTTPNLAITEAYGALLRPLRRIGVPAHELSMMMGIALRFLPQFVREWRDIYHAQTLRGASFSGKGRLQALGALLVPLFTSAFRHAETLAGAMDSRCYHGDAGRTHLHPFALSMLDFWGVVAVLAMLAALLAANLLPF